MRTGGMGADRWILTTLTGGQPNLHSQESYSRWHSDQERTSRCVLLLIPLSSVSLLPLPRLTWPYFFLLCSPLLARRQVLAASCDDQEAIRRLAHPDSCQEILNSRRYEALTQAPGFEHVRKLGAGEVGRGKREEEKGGRRGRGQQRLTEQDGAESTTRTQEKGQ